MNLKTLKLQSALFSLALATLSTAVAQTSSPTIADPSGTALTRNPVFHKNCAKCHGKTAAGRHFGGPSLISEKTTSASADDLRNVITKGKGRMPKYASKLTTEEIDTLVQQIKASNNK
jgi:mono/diheme cytochrome c family protein